MYKRKDIRLINTKEQFNVILCEGKLHHLVPGTLYKTMNPLNITEGNDFLYILNGANVKLKNYLKPIDLKVIIPKDSTITKPDNEPTIKTDTFIYPFPKFTQLSRYFTGCKNVMYSEVRYFDYNYKIYTPNEYEEYINNIEYKLNKQTNNYYETSSSNFPSSINYN